MPIAINTKIGQMHEERGRNVLVAFGHACNAQVVLTNSKSLAVVDGLLARDGVVVAVVEVKTRDEKSKYSWATIERYGTYLVTADKLRAAMAVGAALAVPAYLVVELSCGTRLCWRLSNKKGHQLFEWQEQNTITRATSIDSTTTTRLNAYLPIEKAKHWETRNAGKTDTP